VFLFNLVGLGRSECGTGGPSKDTCGHSIGVGEADSDGLADPDGETEGETEVEGDGVTEGDGEGVTEDEGVTEGEGVTDGVGEMPNLSTPTWSSGGVMISLPAAWFTAII